MKTFLFSLLTLCMFNTYGQDKPEEKPEKKPKPNYNKIQIGILFSPDIAYRKLKNNDGSSSSDMIITMRDQNEIAKFGYTTGLQFCYNIKKNLGLELGIQYSNKGYQTQSKQLTFDPNVPSTSATIKYINNFHSVDIPLKVNYMFGKSKLRLLTSAGLTTHLFFNETKTSIITYADRTERKTNPSTENYKTHNFSPTVGLGMDYQMTNNMNLRIEPTFRYGIMNIIETPVTATLYNAGINVAYYIGF